MPPPLRDHRFRSVRRPMCVAGALTTAVVVVCCLKIGTFADEDADSTARPGAPSTVASEDSVPSSDDFLSLSDSRSSENTETQRTQRSVTGRIRDLLKKWGEADEATRRLLETAMHESAVARESRSRSVAGEANASSSKPALDPVRSTSQVGPTGSGFAIQQVSATDAGHRPDFGSALIDDEASRRPRATARTESPKDGGLSEVMRRPLMPAFSEPKPPAIIPDGMLLTPLEVWSSAAPFAK